MKMTECRPNKNVVKSTQKNIVKKKLKLKKKKELVERNKVGCRMEMHIWWGKEWEFAWAQTYGQKWENCLCLFGIQNTDIGNAANANVRKW